MLRCKDTWNTTVLALKRAEGFTFNMIRATLIWNSVKKDTLKQYVSHARRMLEFSRAKNQLKQNGEKIALPDRLVDPKVRVEEGKFEETLMDLGKEFSKEAYVLFLTGHAGLCPMDFAKARAALRFGQLLAGVELWAASPEMIDMEHQAIRTAQLGRQDARRRGTLTRKMIDGLLTYAKKRDMMVWRAMRIQLGAALRIGELIRLTPEHITGEEVIIVDPKGKTAKSTTSTRVTTSKKRLAEWKQGKVALCRLQTKAASTQPGALLFPRSEFTIKTYNRIIREAAVALGWPKDLKFDGSHVLRHAGVRIAVETLQPTKSIEAMGKILVMSVSMILHYALSNEERLEKIYRPRFLTGVKESSVPAKRDDSEDEDELFECIDIAEDEFEETLSVVEVVMLGTPAVPRSRGPSMVAASARASQASTLQVGSQTRQSSKRERTPPEATPPVVDEIENEEEEVEEEPSARTRRYRQRIANARR